jgi:hypothetical protein
VKNPLISSQAAILFSSCIAKSSMGDLNYNAPCLSRLTHELRTLVYSQLNLHSFPNHQDSAGLAAGYSHTRATAS